MISTIGATLIGRRNLFKVCIERFDHVGIRQFLKMVIINKNKKKENERKGSQLLGNSLMHRLLN